MGIRVTPSAVTIGSPTMLLVSTISCTFSMAVRMRSLRGDFRSICSMKTVLSYAAVFGGSSAVCGGVISFVSSSRRRLR